MNMAVAVETGQNKFRLSLRSTSCVVNFQEGTQKSAPFLSPASTAFVAAPAARSHSVLTRAHALALAPGGPLRLK